MSTHYKTTTDELEKLKTAADPTKNNLGTSNENWPKVNKKPISTESLNARITELTEEQTKYNAALEEQYGKLTEEQKAGLGLNKGDEKNPDKVKAALKKLEDNKKTDLTKEGDLKKAAAGKAAEQVGTGATGSEYIIPTQVGEQKLGYNFEDGKIYKLDAEGIPIKDSALTDTESEQYKAAMKNVQDKVGSSTASRYLGAPPGGYADALVSGVQWAGVAWGAAQLVNQMLGMFMGDWNQDKQKALAMAVLAGTFTFKFLDILGKGKTDIGSWYGKLTSGKFGWAGKIAHPLVIAGLAAYFIFASMYKDTKTHSETIEFKCMLWQAPRGGADCNKCNTDPLKPCSEYRCKSLGQACKLINAGTGFEKCINSAQNDVTSPGIKPDEDALTPGYAYSEVKPRPAGSTSGTSGMKIVDAQTGGCVKAFSAFKCGVITTDVGDKTQPAQCKIEYNHTKSFKDMTYFMGDENKFTEKHSETITLPNTDTLNVTFPGVKNDGEYTIYIRCSDGNENTNEDSKQNW